MAPLGPPAHGGVHPVQPQNISVAELHRVVAGAQRECLSGAAEASSHEPGALGEHGQPSSLTSCPVPLGVPRASRQALAHQQAPAPCSASTPRTWPPS